MKHYIYLVGQISVDEPETYKWRELVREHFKNYDCFNIIDPCNNAFNQTMLGKYKHIDAKRQQVYKENGIDVLVSKDYSFVKKSTIAIADLNIYDPKKAIIGSFYELAWYFLHPEKTVIGVFSGDESLHTAHPFVKASVTTWVKSHKEACELIKFYFKD